MPSLPLPLMPIDVFLELFSAYPLSPFTKNLRLSSGMRSCAVCYSAASSQPNSCTTSKR